MRIASFVGAIAAVAIACSGCTDTDEAGPSSPSPIAASLSGEPLPADWPAAVPVPSGEVVHTGWDDTLDNATRGMVIVRVSDTTAQDDYLELLRNQGWQVEESTQDTVPDEQVYHAATDEWAMDVVVHELDGAPMLGLQSVRPADS